MYFIKYHWFGLLTGLVIFFFMGLFILVLLSPRADEQKRGFIPCTENMAEQILACENNKIICLLKAVVGNSWCDAKVVGRGIKKWIFGEQKAPWSNYIFIPELPSNHFFDSEAGAEYLKQHPNTKAEMQKLQKLNEELENAEESELQITADQQPE